MLRSGSIWLRTMLVNIMIPYASRNPDVFNAAIPCESIKQAPHNRRCGHHELSIVTYIYYRPEIKRSVYTIRDGRDVLISCYHYLKPCEMKKCLSMNGSRVRKIESMGVAGMRMFDHDLSTADTHLVSIC